MRAEKRAFKSWFPEFQTLCQRAVDPLASLDQALHGVDRIVETGLLFLVQGDIDDAFRCHRHR